MFIKSDFKIPFCPPYVKFITVTGYLYIPFFLIYRFFQWYFLLYYVVYVASKPYINVLIYF